MVALAIQFDLGKLWAHCGDTAVRGYGHLDGRYLTGLPLAQALDASASKGDLPETLKRLNGCFAVVIRRNAKLHAAVDRIRSMPLFYAMRAGECFMSDTAAKVLEWLGTAEPNPIADAEFRLTGYVTGHETLYAGVCQVEAGELVAIDPARPSAIERHRYHRFHHRDFLREEKSAVISRLDEVHHRVFRRLVESIDGRTMVVPLSGGFDSRLICVMLRDMGLRDVICFTYGVAGDWETRISREVAQHLGFKWIYVPYSADRWRHWAGLEAFREYFRNAGNLASVPHVQDWPAVLELQRGKEIPPDSVFVPGHTGDFLTGGHIPKWYVERRTIRRKEFFDSLLDAHYSLWDWPRGSAAALREEFQRRIEGIVGPVQDCSPEQAADLIERWDLQERQAKLICNSVRVYESFGFDWRLPLFDSELMQFWEQVPIEDRTRRKLYMEYVEVRQRLPVTQANRDHSGPVLRLVQAIDAMGLRPLAKRLQRMIRKVLWRRAYERSQHAWFAMFDPALVRRTYTGKELFYSYLSAQYRDLVLGVRSEPPRAGARTDP